MIPLDGQFLLSIAPVFSGREALAQRRIVFALSDRISSVLAEFEIDTPLRIAHFMAQITHECAGFRTTQEFADGTAYEGSVYVGCGYGYTAAENIRLGADGEIEGLF